MNKKHKKSGSVRHTPHSKDRRIVLLDQIPLRDEAGKDARKKMRESVRLTETLSEFERTILPGYERWVSENLAALLDEEKHLDFQIQRMERTISRVHLESLWGDRSCKSVYKDIAREELFQERSRQREQESRGQRPDDDPESGEPENPSHSGDPDFDSDAGLPENERVFRSYARFACGIEPENLSPRDYQRMFKDFRKWHEAQSGRAATRGGPAHTGLDNKQRVKELYRVLARRLHPDSARPDPNQERLWHDLQEAYGSQDVERMEVLLAMTDLHAGNDALSTTLYHLRKVAREMAQTVRELKSRLREARESQAWMFWHAIDREKFGIRLRSEIESRIHDAKRHLALLEKEISRWRTEPKARKNSPPPSVPGQDHFRF